TLLGVSGWWARYRCLRGQLRRSTYTNAAALTLAATLNLAMVRNAEGAAVATYAVAAAIVALVIQGREWLWWGAILALSALAGSPIPPFAWLPQIELPETLAATALVFSVTPGLGVPMALFWLFSRDLTSSREEAWGWARQAGDATRLASQRAHELEARS